MSNEEIRIKYPAEIAEKFIQQANEIDILSNEYNSDKFSIGIKQNLFITKKKKEANFTVAICKESENKVAIIKEPKDPSQTHKYSYANVITVVEERLKKQNIKLDYKKVFNQYVLNLIIDFYKIKDEPKYSYCHKIGNSTHYTYSEQFIEFILSEIKKDPHNFVESLKKV